MLDTQEAQEATQPTERRLIIARARMVTITVKQAPLDELIAETVARHNIRFQDQISSGCRTELTIPNDGVSIVSDDMGLSLLLHLRHNYTDYDSVLDNLRDSFSDRKGLGIANGIIREKANKKLVQAYPELVPYRFLSATSKCACCKQKKQEKKHKKQQDRRALITCGSAS
jgi:hypothetical protein